MKKSHHLKLLFVWPTFNSLREKRAGTLVATPQSFSQWHLMLTQTLAGVRLEPEDFWRKIDMFPIGDDDTQRRTFPIVTYALIILNILFFLVELSGGESFIMQWSLVPRRFMANPAGDFPTIFTSMFMHAGWLHLLGNMLYLWIFGDNVEDQFGHAKFLVFYLLCGIAATFAQMLFNSGSGVPNLGASGAIAGVLGSYIVLFPRGQVRVLMGRGVIPMPALVVIGLWIVLQLVSGIGTISQSADTGGVAYLAHIGGFVAGLVLTFLFRTASTRRATI